jgi:hypothetical protein
LGVAFLVLRTAVLDLDRTALARVTVFLALTFLAALFFAAGRLRLRFVAILLVDFCFTVFFAFSLSLADFLAIKSCPPEIF